MQSIWQRFGLAEVDLFASKESAHRFSLNPPAPLRLDAMVQTRPEGVSVNLFPNRSAYGSSAEDPLGGVKANISPVLASLSMVCRHGISPGRLSVGDSD